MASIDTIRRIRVQQVSEGADTVRRDLQGLVDAQGKVAAATEATSVVTETASRRQLSAATAYQRVLQQVDANARSANAYERALSTLNRAAGQGVVAGEEQARVLGLIESRYGAVARAAQEAATAQRRAWSDVGAAGSKVLENIEASRKLGSLGTGALTAANSNGRLRADQVQNLAFQGSDILSSLGSGSNLSTVAFQQGPQIAQVFGGPGGASVKGAFAQASEAATGLAARLGVVGGAVAGLATITLAGVAAFSSYRSAQAELEKSLTGIGRASGTTAGQINALAPAAAVAGNVSVRSAREMAGQFAATGQIGSEMYAGLIGTAKDYAATTGQELPDATKALAAAFADPAKGADTLNAQLGFLNDTTRENVQRLQAQGDRLGAQKVLLDAYRTGLTSATELTSGWGRATAAVGTIISNTWDAAGEAIDRVVTGGDLETRLATAQKVLENSRNRAAGVFGTILPSLAGSDVTAARDEVARLQAQVDKRDAASRQAQQAQVSLRIGDIVRGLDPAAEAIKKISDQASDIGKNLSRLPFDEQGAARSAMEGLVAQSRILKENMAAGGEQYAASLRQAQFGQRTVGFTPQGLSAAQIENDIAERGRQAQASGPRDQQLAALQTLELERTTRLKTLDQQSTLDLNAVGGAFSRMAQSLQQQIIAAANASGRIPAGIIAGIGGHESGSNPNVGYSKILGENGRPSSAYGLGQITKGTAEEAVRGGYLPQGYDRTDPATMAQGIAGVLSMKMDQNGGSLDRAIMAYRGSSDPRVNQSYLADVKRRAGEMGDASVGAQAKDQDAYTRALRDQQQALQNATQNYGKNGLALDANSEAARRYNALLDAGVPASDALSASIHGLATQTATAARQLKITQFASDTGFERDQLGRDRYDQGAYAKARATVGDTDSTQARFVIDQSRQTAVLTDARASFSDAFGGFAQDLRRGTSAAQAASNALGKLSDKLISTFTDSITSSLFGSAAKGGGGFLSGLFGGSKDSGLPNLSFSPFAMGGVMTSRGPVPLNAYANGGVANSPQMAIFGEGRMNEAYVPLPDGKRIPVAMAGPANSNSQSNTDARNYNIDLRGSTLTREEVSAALTKAIAANNAEQDRTHEERAEYRRRAGL
ncbi:transglycosylase SLT domain-containing protein [Methylobacterium sp. WL30]|uniref:phage tail length tape measure family protein n=1 Tax=unclassified Methylobacterium TaxID=2615210 RepID=UPI0011C90AB2|nr:MULTISPECIES: phage tail length tape measure family protein [unclassified Methylobacterium]TXN40447.1 transglycosylase SLT domain-containing protein [Methylobacterium sp. WL93]TXN49156.1 transglycosylase SLT domain-containing protein [Methylobacterium sp. WL119]TXN68963.1 transglycosylase SLT domain-containing protein [Methylobacterium sp. WL30]